MSSSRAAGSLRQWSKIVKKLQRKHQALRLAPVEHTDEELHRRLKSLQRHAAPFFTVSLSDDRKTIVCTRVRTGKVRFVDSADALWD